MSYITFQPSDYFNTKLWNGNSSTQAITGVGFQPDFVWLKQRTGTQRHQLLDAIRGANVILKSDGTDASGADTDILNSFDSDGYTLGYQDQSNDTGATYVGWNWKANGSGSSNTDGTINTTYTSANTTSGMSIIQYSGNGTAGATIGHGIGVAPKCVIIKRTDTTSNWIFGTGARGFDKFLYLNTTGAETDNAGTFNDTAPSSSVITLGSWNDVNNSSGTYIAYCFAEKKGFSKFGSYTGNGNADGSFIYLGFKPAFVIFKQTNTTGNWGLLDSTRSYANVANHTLAANLSNAESSFGGGESVFGASNKVDILSNGIKIRENSAYNNTSGGSYIYMAFASAPLVSSNGVPAVAR